MRRQLARALREFHHFLVKVYGFPAVSVSEVFGIGRGLVPVDANLLTMDEYFKVRDVVLRRAPSKEIAQIALILLSLGFWLGLRRAEARGLRTIDVHELGLPMLLVRAWLERRLKSKASARVLPLQLMPGDELAILLAWKQKRQKDDDHGEDHFGLPHLDQDIVAVAMFALIQAAMWEPRWNTTFVQSAFSTIS